MNESYIHWLMQQTPAIMISAVVIYYLVALLREKEIACSRLSEEITKLAVITAKATALLDLVCGKFIKKDDR